MPTLDGRGFLASWEAARLTGTLRAYGGVCHNEDTELDLKIRREKFAALERRENGQEKLNETVVWKDIQTSVNQLQSSQRKKGTSNLQEILHLMSGVVTDGVGTQALQEYAEQMITILLPVQELSWREMVWVKDKFGHIDDAVVNKIYSLLQEVRELVPLAFNSSDESEQSVQFGAKFKFIYPSCTDFDDAEDSEEYDVVSDQRTEVGVFAAAVEATRSAELQGKPGPDKPGWLAMKCSDLFTSPSPPALPLDDLCVALYEMLSGKQSDDQLQEGLFELLGYNAFDLISELLQNRYNIKAPTAFDIFSHPSNVPQQPHFKQDNRAPPIATQVTILTEREKVWAKQMRKDDKKLRKEFSNQQKVFDPEALREQREYALMTANVMPSLLPRQERKTELPYVFDTRVDIKQTAAYVLGAKVMLPDDTLHKSKGGYEEYSFPATKAELPGWTDHRVPVSSLDPIGQIAFKGVKELNRIQSVVFETAYNSNENLLISAPTGAGKTNIALLTVVKLIRNNIEQGVLQRDKFKIVYVTPMKALAAEMTKTFGAKLQGLGITVKELTGDMQLTKTEISKTQMLIVTPEKWDVVTRKSTGDTALSQLVRLLIIDEVHLLHEERGAVIETIVARTQRQVETTQTMIRIVGLSATLPNYLDVAMFLNVNLYKGLFYFDSRFRPVPLKQTFVGVRGSNKFKTREHMDVACYEKVLESVKNGDQVLVFVHTRNGTLKTAEKLREIAQTEGELELFSCNENPKFADGMRQLNRAGQKKLKYLYSDGFSIHHAGLPRSDRNIVGQLFQDGLVKVLCCTATLAWGVNLPAHTVVIKGTEYYDASKGEFVDIGMLDVLQIFGRAGRPQYDTSGHGIIITPHDKMHKYLQLLMQQQPIESQFIRSLEDNLNAEICLGTVGNIEEAISWLKYTFLWVRMQKNALLYGITQKMRELDPDLHHHLTDLVKKAARSLDKSRMIRFDETTMLLSATDLGRTASHFYIKHPTIEHFNESFKPNLHEAEILACVSQADEFSQLKVQEEEGVELSGLLADRQFDVKGGTENVYGKVNILLQAYISQLPLNSFNLVSDTAYIAQNGSRIIRAMFDIAVHNGYPVVASKLLGLCKMLKHRMWQDDCPLRQFNILTHQTIEKLERAGLNINRLRDMKASEIGHMIRHVSMGEKVKACVKQFPQVGLEVNVQPITSTVLKIKLIITPQFEWNDRVHGKMSEPWWIWVEDTGNDHMYHSEYFSLQKKHVVDQDPQTLCFSIPLFDKDNVTYIVRMISDSWIGAEASEIVTVKGLIMPEDYVPHTQLLDLQPLPCTAINHPDYNDYFKFTHFNPIQTQVFHSIFHTDTNVLVGAPTGSGKTVAAELAIFRVFINYPGDKCVYIAPLKALVKERMNDWGERLGKKLGKKIVELTGDVVPDMKAVVAADLIITTPEKWDGISRSWQNRKYVQSVRLLVIDEIHLLGNDRGPVLEVIVSRTNFISSHTEQAVRVVGLSTALANAGDVGAWLHIDSLGMFNFKPSVRPVPLEVHITGFPGQHYCPRMATMNKPAYNDIRIHSVDKPVLIFVASRRQTRLTAYDLISHAVAHDHKQWVHMDEEELEMNLDCIIDTNLKHTLRFGIGLHHAGLQEKDRKRCETLFLERKIQLLVATATLAWGVNLPAHLVIIKGTEYFDGKTHRYQDFPITDVLQMMGRAGRPQYDDQGIACIYVHDIKKHFYKKFLYEPFPVESNLLVVLTDHFNAEIVAGTIKSKQDAMDYLTWTYFFRRLLRNPSFYELPDLEASSINSFLSGIVADRIGELEQSYCVGIEEDNRTLVPLVMGCIASYYYLSHKTVKLFADRLNPNSDMNAILKLLCDVTEYDEMPVRHNEDGVNEEMASSLPIRVTAHSYDDPHTKVHLLLQAHFSRQAMPMTDYITDLKSVHDQAMRILQAMLDVASDNGWLKVVLGVMHLCKMVIQGLWVKDNPLLQLPKVEQHHLPLFYNLQSLNDDSSFPRIITTYANRGHLLKKSLTGEFKESDITYIHKIMKELPLLRVSYNIRGAKLLDKNYVPCKTKAGQAWEPLHADNEYTLNVNLGYRNKDKQGRKVFAPRYNKPVDETWWIALGEVETGELIAMKRVQFRGKSCSTSLAFYTPEEPGRHIYTIYLISQQYLGLDQQYDVYLDVLEPEINYLIDEELGEEDFKDWLGDDEPDVPRKPGVHSKSKEAKEDAQDSGPPGFSKPEPSPEAPPGLTFSRVRDGPPGFEGTKHQQQAWADIDDEGGW